MDHWIELPNGDEQEIEVVLNAKFEVCWTCGGKGTHVSKSIDSNGISAEDFDRDPDFREEYFSGMYDVTCEECKGRNVTLIVDDENNTPENLKIYFDYLDDCYRDQMERDAERRAGC